MRAATSGTAACRRVRRGASPRQTSHRARRRLRARPWPATAGSSTDTRARPLTSPGSSVAIARAGAGGIANLNTARVPRIGSRINCDRCDVDRRLAAAARPSKPPARWRRVCVERDRRPCRCLRPWPTIGHRRGRCDIRRLRPAATPRTAPRRAARTASAAIARRVFRRARTPTVRATGPRARTPRPTSPRSIAVSTSSPHSTRGPSSFDVTLRRAAVGADHAIDADAGIVLIDRGCGIADGPGDHAEVGRPAVLRAAGGRQPFERQRAPRRGGDDHGARAAAARATIRNGCRAMLVRSKRKPSALSQCVAPSNA